MNKGVLVFLWMNSKYKVECLALTWILLVSFHSKSYTQEVAPVVPAVKLSGFVKTDVFYDSRQTISAREGHFLLYPAPRTYDFDGNDINSKASFNILPIHSNLAVNVNGPSILGATVTSLLEGDFFGQSNTDVNMLRMRHAYIKLQWSKTELLAGQYWHPLFVVSCYPGTVSFNTGAPIQPFSRAPQIRISQTVNILKLSLSLLSQRDNTSVGPDGNNSKYLRDSGMPEIQFSGELKVKKQNEFVMGAGVGYKKLMPQIKTGNNYKTSETVQGITSNLYMKNISKNLTVKFEGIYLENGSEFLSLSGYAIKDSVDIEKGFVTYAPVRTISYWGEIHTNGRLLQFGVFSGYTQNLGTKSKVSGPFYLNGNLSIKSVYRISPRIIVKTGSMILATELEYTSALYGKPDEYGKMLNTTKSDNFRLLLSAMYKF